MKKFNLAVAFAAVATMAVASSASAVVVARHQGQFAKIIAVNPERVADDFANVWTHTYDVVLDTCDGAGSFEGVGVGIGFPTWKADPYTVNETITGFLDGNLVDGHITFTSTQVSGDCLPLDGCGFETMLTDAPLDGTTVTVATSNPSISSYWTINMKVDATNVRPTSFRNHGEYVNYVTALGGDVVAAEHSCIGMPIN